MDRQPISTWFSWSCRELAAGCHRLGLVAPGFRSPPADPSVDRALRWLPDDGGPLVAVRIHRRTHAAIRDDLVAGVLAANGLGPSDEGHAELRALLSDLVPIPEGSCAA